MKHLVDVRSRNGTRLSTRSHLFLFAQCLREHLAITTKNNPPDTTKLRELRGTVRRHRRLTLASSVNKAMPRRKQREEGARRGAVWFLAGERLLAQRFPVRVTVTAASPTVLPYLQDVLQFAHDLLLVRHGVANWCRGSVGRLGYLRGPRQRWWR